MLDTAANVNSKLVLFSYLKSRSIDLKAMQKIIVQIYEIQDPYEAEKLIDIGVDHIGSVIISDTDWKSPGVRDTTTLARSAAVKSSLIPLFNALDPVLRILDYYQPDIVHFCEDLTDQKNIWDYCRRLIKLQDDVKNRFPQISVMRSIPIAQAGKKNTIPTLKIGELFEPVSDFFLTDTILIHDEEKVNDSQPVPGFVGITGQTCNWDTAADLVASCRIPVILAGGISPSNVTKGIERVRPDGVDSCTLTNALDEIGYPLRFKKDLQKVKQFVEAVRKVERNLAVTT